MPVRIYEIAKSLGVQSKDVLAVRVKHLQCQGSSSSLDKITAEYLEQQLSTEQPAKPESPTESESSAETTAVEKSPSGPVLIVADEPQIQEIEPESETDSDSENSSPSEQDDSVATAATESKEQETANEPTETKASNSPKVGQHVGFVDLGGMPTRREPRRREKKDDKKKPSPADKKTSGNPARPSAPKFTAKADAPVITLKPPIMVRELAEAINRKPFNSLPILCSSACLLTSTKLLMNRPLSSSALTA